MLKFIQGAKVTMIKFCSNDSNISLIFKTHTCIICTLTALEMFPCKGSMSIYYFLCAKMITYLLLIYYAPFFLSHICTCFQYLEFPPLSNNGQKHA